MARETEQAAHPLTLGEKLDEMTLNDETRNPRDKGYMDAVREIRDWLAHQPAERSAVGEERS
jgi:hypothetical protein